VPNSVQIPCLHYVLYSVYALTSTANVKNDIHHENVLKTCTFEGASNDRCDVTFYVHAGVSSNRIRGIETLKKNLVYDT